MKNVVISELALYRVISFLTYNSFVNICDARIDSVALEKTYSLDDLLGYLQSWSGYQTLRRCHPEAEDPLVDIATRYVVNHISISGKECRNSVVLFVSLYGSACAV